MYIEPSYGSTLFYAISIKGQSIRAGPHNHADLCDKSIIYQIGARPPYLGPISPCGPDCTIVRAICPRESCRRPSRSVAPVQRPILDSLRQVRHRQAVRPFQVRNRPRHFQDPVMRPCRQPLLLHSPLQQPLGVLSQLAIRPDLPRRHLRIRVDLFPVLLESRPLPLPRIQHPVPNLRRTLCRSPAAQLLLLNGRHFDMYIDAVLQRIGDLCNILLNHRRRAQALPRLVVEIPTGLRVSSLLNPASSTCPSPFQAP